MLQCLAASGRCNPIFGVIRRSALAQTSLIGNFIASDYILLLQLALLGTFRLHPETLFFNRDHPQRSGRACRDLRQHAEWYDPTHRAQFQLRWSRLGWEYFRSVQRMPLRVTERYGCMVVLLHWLRWHWQEMAAEWRLSASQAVLSWSGNGSKLN